MYGYGHCQGHVIEKGNATQRNDHSDQGVSTPIPEPHGKRSRALGSMAAASDRDLARLAKSGPPRDLTETVLPR